ncbi:MAG TPA: tRNA uridine-5-carboxymethylaminomethyl(34) synthesis GTPase MnmE [Desulfonatronum sp.]|nr:tRNA uridine-5-carboxymethylaminomethyl(34) synthesis GTPase MnmE [Desulfonatronum sp.]
MNNHRTETIAAVATPVGHGAVGLIRISGPHSLNAVLRLFTSSRPNVTCLKPYRLHHGHLRDSSGRILDEVLVSFMPGPGSFTGEDVVEINCHGSPVILRSVLEALQTLDVRAADPGEFTQRAFLNGRMDLTQAEAVAEVINAVTPTAALLAQTKLAGSLHERIQSLKSALEDLRAQLCLAVDFPEDEVECLAPETFLNAMTGVQEQVLSLLRNHETTRIWNDGALCVLTGPVNAGKSSLLNALLGRDRAIVSDVPGTTRDYIEAAISLRGLTIRLVDTAGTRPSGDPVELAGLNLGRELRAQADLLLLVLDGSRPLAPHEEALLSDLNAANTLVVLNKADLFPAEPDQALHFERLGFETLRISVKTGHNLNVLQERLHDRLTTRTPAPAPGTLVPNLRQSLALHRADMELRTLMQDIRTQVPYDLLGVRLESVCAILAEITGEITSEEVLHHIFSRFCIGK